MVVDVDLHCIIPSWFIVVYISGLLYLYLYQIDLEHLLVDELAPIQVYHHPSIAIVNECLV